MSEKTNPMAVEFVMVEHGKIIPLRGYFFVVALIQINMTSDFEKAFQHIQNEELEEGLQLVAENLLRDCIMLIASITKEQNKYELYSLFYDSYLDFANKVREGKFSYVSDSAFKSFFKTACSHKAKEHKRIFRKNEDWLSESFFDRHFESFDELFQENRKTEYDLVYEKYGISISTSDIDQEFPVEVIKAFHKLNEKCKFLVVLKYMINLSHKEIVDCLCNFYELKNENVSKSELKRCLDNLKKQTAKRLN